MESVVKHVEQTKDRWTDEYMMLKLLHVHTQTDSQTSAVVTGLQHSFCSVQTPHGY